MAFCSGGPSWPAQGFKACLFQWFQSDIEHSAVFLSPLTPPAFCGASFIPSPAFLMAVSHHESEEGMWGPQSMMHLGVNADLYKV